MQIYFTFCPHLCTKHAHLFLFSNENDNEVKHMRNKPVAGFALPGMTLGQVKLRSLKSEDSRPSNKEKGKTMGIFNSLTEKKA